jgi:RNA polymerase sigma-70 factor (ECF subfamily)
MEHNDPHDAELVAQTLAGNREAFGQLYDSYARLVRAVAAGVSGDWPAVDDMVQECFLRAYRNLIALRDPHRFGPWIVGIARQVGRERRRALRRDRHEFGKRSEIDSITAADAVVFEGHDLELVMQKLADLPEKERLAVHAFFLEQRDVPQAAEMLGFSKSGFYLLVRKGIARLAALMQPCDVKVKKG